MRSPLFLMPGLALLFVVWASACARAPADAELSAGASPSVAGRCGVGAPCALGDAACAPDAIVASVDARGERVVCSVCEDGGQELDVCGIAQAAPCFETESAAGGACTRCLTAEGQLLFDDCDEALGAGVATCEETLRATGSLEGAMPCGTDDDCAGDALCVSPDPNGTGACVPSQQIQRCEVCTDERGQVVRERCRPDADRCEDETTPEGRACVACYLGGEFAWRECAPARIAPARCELYGDASARCIDCYGPDDELLSHECTISSPPPVEGALSGDAAEAPPAVYCEVRTLPGGVECSACIDESGQMRVDTCASAERGLRCEALRYSEQTCVVCLDPSGDVQFLDCQAEGCTDAGACAPPPACEVRSDGEGAYCRTCPNSATGQDEQRCLRPHPLYCRYEAFYEEEAGDTSEDAAVSATLCGICALDGAETPFFETCELPAWRGPTCVWREAEPNGSDTGAGGSVCGTCYAPASGDDPASTCEAPAARVRRMLPDGADAGAAGEEWCAAPRSVELSGQGGAPLRWPARPGSEGEALDATCVACGQGGDVAGAGCRLRPADCIEAVGQSSPAPVACAHDVRSYRRVATQCDDPWGSSGGSRGEVGLLALLSWLYESEGIIPFEGYVRRVADAISCSACDCPSGDVYEVFLDPVHEERLRELGFERTPPSPPEGP